MVTDLPDTVTALALTNWLAVPPPPTALDFSLMADAAMEEGTPVLVLNFTVIVSPTSMALFAPVTSIVYWAIDLALVGVTVTVAESKSALAGLAVNMPKTNMAPITPMAMSSTSPKDVPILVFIYSYLLDLRA
jgi:hypothetical protein